jgi:SAM-dependent methyltransferase
VSTTHVSAIRLPAAESPEHEAGIARVRELLARADYTADGIAAAGVDLGLGVRATDAAVLGRALRPVEPLATLVRLFLLGAPLRVVDVERRIGRDEAVLEELGFLERRGDAVEAPIRLTPWRGFVIAHDPDPAGPLWPEHVSGPTPAAETLADLIVSRPGTRALDVGTGSGLLALLLARDAATVVATDINPAAQRYASLNARLNGIATIETRIGDLFEPVGDERFGVIVSNPPYVISPETDLVFRHSAMGRDELSRQVIRDAAAHLDEGGVAHVLVNWVQRPGDRWQATLEEWVGGTGCDAILLLHGMEDPFAYAVRWNLRAQQVTPATHAATLDSWLAYYRTEGIDAIASGGVILRRRGGANWVQPLELRDESRGAAGPQIEAILAGVDYLAALADDRDMLGAAITVDAPHRLDQALVSREGSYIVESASLVLEHGLGNRLLVEPDLIPVLIRMDGTQTLQEIADEVADGTGAHRGQLTRRVMQFARALLEGGFATPPRAGGTTS